MSNAVAARKDERARRKAERMMEKQREAAEHDLPRSMRPSPITKTITVIVLVVALIYFLFPIYWAIIASTKTPSQLTSSNGLWFAVGLDQIPDAIATNYSKLMGWTRGQFWRWVLNSLIYSGVSALIGTIISVMAGYRHRRGHGMHADAGRTAHHSAVLHLPRTAPDQHHAGDHHPVLRFAIRLLPRTRVRANLRTERTAGSGPHRRRR